MAGIFLRQYEHLHCLICGQPWTDGHPRSVACQKPACRKALAKFRTRNSNVEYDWTALYYGCQCRSSVCRRKKDLPLTCHIHGGGQKMVNKAVNEKPAAATTATNNKSC